MYVRVRVLECMLVSRAYCDEIDHMRVMDFLRDTYAETCGLENWLPPRFENNIRDMDSWIRLWALDGRLVGLVVPEEPFSIFCPAASEASVPV